MICPASPPLSHLSVVVIRGGGISCHVRVQAAGIACRSARTWEEPPVNPPSARHGTFAEQGPPTLKACSREQTQHRDLPCTGLTILGDRRAARRGGATQTHTKRAHLSAWHLDTCSSLRCKKEKCRCPRSAVHSKTLYGSVLRRQRAFLKCPVQLRGWCATCVQQGAPTCRHTWDNPGAQESKWRYQKSVTPHFTWQGMSWVIIK